MELAKMATTGSMMEENSGEKLLESLSDAVRQEAEEKKNKANDYFKSRYILNTPYMYVYWGLSREKMVSVEKKLSVGSILMSVQDIALCKPLFVHFMYVNLVQL